MNAFRILPSNAKQEIPERPVLQYQTQRVFREANNSLLFRNEKKTEKKKRIECKNADEVVIDKSGNKKR